MDNIMFAALRACHGLQRIDFIFQRYYLEYYCRPEVTMTNANSDLLVAVRGLKSLNVKIEPYNQFQFGSSTAYDEHVLRSKVCRESLESALRKAMAVEKDETYRPSKHFPLVLEYAKLDIDGEGRLGDDRKPGVIASRTRQGTKNLSKVDVFGVLPTRVRPKYNIDGELTWGKPDSFSYKIFYQEVGF